MMEVGMELDDQYENAGEAVQRSMKSSFRRCSERRSAATCGPKAFCCATKKFVDG
jgi:hypothetical protein